MFWPLVGWLNVSSRSPVLRFQSLTVRSPLAEARKRSDEAQQQYEIAQKQFDKAQAEFDSAKALHKRATDAKMNQELTERILDAARMRLADAQRKLSAPSMRPLKKAAELAPGGRLPPL